MMATRNAALILVLVLVAGCAGTRSSTRPHGTGVLETHSADVEGTLVEVRHYFETNAIGGDHVFCAFMSALGELPVGVLTADGTVVMLTSRPSRLAAYMTKPVRVHGELTQTGRLLVPATLRVKNGTSWTAAEL